ncbi:MAG TPA: conditioned medium factor [Oceanospirillales bacterium]|nr:conditioned medium factor [Oceanospirillales bacterium]
MKQKKLLSVVLPLMMAVPSILTAKVLNNKQLAGPPEEFELMQPMQPELSSITSKTALIPVNLEVNKSGSWEWNANLPVDNNDFSFMILSGGAKNWNIELINPKTQEVFSADEIASENRFSKYGIEGNSYEGQRYTFNNIDTGNWDIRISSETEPDQFEGFVLISNKSKYRLNSYRTNLDLILDHNINFVTQSTSNEETIEVLKDVNPIKTASMLVTYPQGNKEMYTMYDDGLHGDKLAGDGLFGADFKASQVGGYTVQIKATGINPNGTPFYRTTEHYFPVIEQTISLDNNKATAFAINDNRLNIALDVKTSEKAANDARYRIIAEVWGQDAKGQMTPISWVSTITDVQKGQLNVELDGRWIQMAKASAGNFELRNLRIEDASNFIPLIAESNMDLKVNSMPKMLQKSFTGEITQEMMMGVPPKTNNTRASSKLLLVHGYCSSDVWGPYSGQFSNSATFYDLKKNRTHDDFANRIKNFGSGYSSFGVVAHSQGGAASLHLYTYYWSGLDYSSGQRMIQSVGTPYQGTPLAGNLAAIGDVFGVGCGYNYNLTTSGASSWLSGIPTWARNQVNYYTTSFSTKWWRYDYCSMGTDMFLSDPEDGVIEKSRGQLSGAYNRGHKTGWCHSLDMRDPGQTSDSSRNYSMSYYAKR